MRISGILGIVILLTSIVGLGTAATVATAQTTIENGKVVIKGPNGTITVNGKNGGSGPAGPAGPQGATGPAGPQGIAGPAGTNGTSLDNQTLAAIAQLTEQAPVLNQVFELFQNGSLKVDICVFNASDNSTTCPTDGGGIGNQTEPEVEPEPQVPVGNQTNGPVPPVEGGSGNETETGGNGNVTEGSGNDTFNGPIIETGEFE